MKIGLDIAKRMGVAVLAGPSRIDTIAFSGTAQEQYNFLYGFLGDMTGSMFYVEKLNHFVNANTTRSLLLRTGYIVGSLENWLCDVEYVIATQARKYQGVKTKLEAQALFPGISQDEADAVVVLLYGLKRKHTEFEIRGIDASKNIFWIPDK